MSISKIYFRGHNTGEFSGVTVASCDYGDTELKRSDEDIAGRDGSVTSLANGRHYRAREITIVFNVKAAPATVEGVLSSLRAWLAGGTGALTDDFNTGWELRDVCFETAHTDYIDMFRGCAQLTVKMTAAPRWVKAGTSEQRIFKTTDKGAFAITVTGNAAYTITKSDESTVSGSYTAAAPYKYRLVIYSENVPTVTLNGAALDISQVFTMPASAEISIANVGAYVYAELWHDTREVRL